MESNKIKYIQFDYFKNKFTQSDEELKNKNDDEEPKIFGITSSPQPNEDRRAVTQRNSRPKVIQK